MIVLHVTYQVKPGMRDLFCQEADQIAGKPSRAEAGNLRYDYAYPVHTQDKVQLIEVWRDEAALKAHQATAHFQQMGPLKEQYVLETSIQKFVTI